jgi:hypothetical protein
MIYKITNYLFPIEYVVILVSALSLGRTCHLGFGLTGREGWRNQEYIFFLFVLGVIVQRHITYHFYIVKCRRCSGSLQTWIVYMCFGFGAELKLAN